MLTCVRKKIEQGLVRHNDIQYTCTAPSLQRRIRWHYQNKTFLVSIITEVDTNIAFHGYRKRKSFRQHILIHASICRPEP